MLSEVNRNEIVRRIRQVADPVTIFLFGSFAYGAPTESSDLDIAVVCRNVVSKTKECVKIRK